MSHVELCSILLQKVEGYQHICNCPAISIMESESFWPANCMIYNHKLPALAQGSGPTMSIPILLYGISMTSRGRKGAHFCFHVATFCIHYMPYTASEHQHTFQANRTHHQVADTFCLFPNALVCELLIGENYDAAQAHREEECLRQNDLTLLPE